MTDSNYGKMLYIKSPDGICEYIDLGEKMTINKTVVLMFEESMKIVAIPNKSLVSDRKSENKLKSGKGQIESFKSYKIISLPGLEKEEMARLCSIIKKSITSGEKMSEIAKILEMLIENPPGYIEQFGRKDPVLEIIEYLLYAGEEKVSVLAKKFNVAEDAISVYYGFGVPFINLGFKDEKQWPLIYEPETESLAIQHPDTIREIVRARGVPPDFRIEITNPKTRVKVSLTARDLIRISHAETREFAYIIQGYFSGVPHDQIGRPYVEIKPLAGGRFLLLGPFWLFSVIVRAGSSRKKMEGLIDKNAINEAYLQLVEKGSQEKFIDDDKIFPMVISSGFTEEARKQAGRLEKPVVLISIEDFIRLVDFIENLDTSRKKEVAFWALFRLGKIAKADPSERISKFIEEVTNAISELGEEVSS